MFYHPINHLRSIKAGLFDRLIVTDRRKPRARGGWRCEMNFDTRESAQESRWKTDCVLSAICAAAPGRGVYPREKSLSPRNIICQRSVRRESLRPSRNYRQANRVPLRGFSSFSRSARVDPNFCTYSSVRRRNFARVRYSEIKGIRDTRREQALMDTTRS